MPLVGIGACVSLQFAGLAACKNYFTAANARAGKADPASLTSSQLYLAGAGGGIVNSVVSGPVEHIRIRELCSDFIDTFRAPLFFFSRRRRFTDSRFNRYNLDSPQVCKPKRRLPGRYISTVLGTHVRRYTPPMVFEVSSTGKVLPY